jgi:hypothetical protein
VSARNLYPGAAVSSQAAGTSNSSVGILMLQDLATVKVQIEVQERDISRVRIGSVARVLVDAYPDKAFEAHATRIIHALDPRSRTLGVEMEIASSCSSRECTRASSWWSTVTPIEGESSAVFVVDKGVVGRKPITTGESEGTLVEVIKGLTGDEQVITEGKELVRPGQKVRAEARK